MLIESGTNIVKTELGRINAYYYDDKSLSLAELKILIDAVQAANFITPDKTEELYHKILALAGSRKQEIIRDNIIFYNNHKHTNEDVFDNVEKIECAVRERKQITFYYFDLNENAERVYRKDKKRYITDPVALVFSEDNYYLVAYSQKYRDSVTYRVDRMDTVTVEDTPICKEALIKKKKPETYTEQVFKMYNGKTETVTLEFPGDLLGAVYDKFGESISVRRKDDEKLVVTLTVQISPPFWGWIFQFKGKMKITEPEGLKPDFDIEEFYK